jgi:hypothetical protein
MEEISNALNDRESHPILAEYDIDDIRLSIQETIRVIEKFIFDREIIKKQVKIKKGLVPSNFNTIKKPRDG